MLLLLEASYCRYEHLHDPPGPLGSNASTHQWPYCPLGLLSNLLSTEEDTELPSWVEIAGIE